MLVIHTVKQILAVYIVIISIITFLVYGIDKFRAKHDRYRIPEKVLLFLAAIGGSIGALCGMYFFRHKTRKPAFYIGVPIILILQVILLVVILRSITSP